MKTYGADAFTRVIAQNRTLRELKLFAMKPSTAGMEQFFAALSMNSAIHTLDIGVCSCQLPLHLSLSLSLCVCVCVSLVVN
jgi:hypothetical protein